MSVPNGPAGLPPVAINPTRVGGTFSGTPNAPDGKAPTAINPTTTGANAALAPNAPLSTLPATTKAKINWTPNTGPQSAVAATAPKATQTAGILAADGTVVAGSGGPPYVIGNVTVGTNEVGTTVVLTPPIS